MHKLLVSFLPALVQYYYENKNLVNVRGTRNGNGQKSKRNHGIACQNGWTIINWSVSIYYMRHNILWHAKIFPYDSRMKYKRIGLKGQ